MSVTVDVAGAQLSGAAWVASELVGYLARTGRNDMQVIWAAGVSFVLPNGERGTLLRSALHFLSNGEIRFR